MQYVYNPAGKVTSRIDQRDQKTLYSYDLLGRLLTKRYFGVAEYYDCTPCDPNDPNLPCDPDCEPERIGEPLYAVDPDLIETFTYDGLGRMLSAQKTVNANNVSDSDFTYNDLGLKTAEITTLFAASQVTISYYYDQAGYLTGITYPDGNSVAITPDPLGRIATLKLDGVTEATYDYIGGRVIRRDFAVPDVTYDISYNNLGQATRHRSHIDSTDIVNFAYSFDDNGNIAWQQYDHRSGDPCTAFTYDGLDRLTRADYGIQSENEQFTLDDLGNRTNANLRNGADESYVVDETTNRYNTVGGNNLDYDACGNMTLDPNDYEYQYDFENRMIKITKNETTIAEFTYDPLGRRIEQYDAVADETIRYYYDGRRVLAEFDDTETQLRDYVYGNYLDEVLCKTENNSTLYYVHDHLYSPVALVNAAGTVVERYEYDAYGKRYVFDSSFTTRTDTLYNNFVAFTGQQLYILDNGNLSGMHYNARDYTPPLGRFLQHDPQGMIPEGIYGIEFDSIAQFDDGMNLYEYVTSQPVSQTDSFGLAMAGMNPADPWDVYPPGFPPPPKKPTPPGHIPSPYQHLYGPIQAVCDRYPCCEQCPKEKCKREARVLAIRYYVRMTRWIAERDKSETRWPWASRTGWGGQYNYCYEYASAIMNMGLTSGLTCFNLKRAVDTLNFSGHQYVGLFHVCNKTNCSDRNLDPWSLSDLWHQPLVKPGTCGDIWN